MDDASLTRETTINLKGASAIPDPNPAGPTPIEDVSSGIQPVADFLPKDAPAHSHPTPPPDQPLVTGEADVDMEMANADDPASSAESSAAIPLPEPAAVPLPEPSAIPLPQPSAVSLPESSVVPLPEPSRVLLPQPPAVTADPEPHQQPEPVREPVAEVSETIAAPSEQSLVRPREDDAEDDERATKRSKVEHVSRIELGDVSIQTAEATTNVDEANAPVLEPPPSASSTAGVKLEPVAPSPSEPLPPVENAQADPSAPAPSDVLATKPSIEAPVDTQPSAASNESRYSTAPMTGPQRAYLVEKTKNLKKTKNSLFFLRPVDPAALNIPAYPEIIKNPMDLSTLDQKLKSDQYGTVQDFVNDFRLIINNCRRFNGDNHPVTAAAMALDAYFNKAMESVPSADQPGPQKAVKRSPPAIKAQAPRRESRVAAPAASPVGGSETFALSADGMPQIRRDSTMNRPARAIKPPASREVTYAKPKRKEHQLELKFCEHVLKEIKSQKYAPMNSVFQLPVDPVALNIPHYRQVVKHPMDLSTMAQKLNQGQYAKAGEFKKDFDLMVQNCVTFNPPGNPVRDMGIHLQREFNVLWTNKEKWERANKPESTRATSASGDEESVEEEEDDDEPEDAKQQTIEALQKQLAGLQQMVQGLVPVGKTPKTKKSGKSQSSKQKIGGLSSGATSKKAVSTKPAKAKKPKQVTYEEKQEISEAVGNMSEQQVAKLTSIITENCTKYRDMEDMELEIDDLPNDVQLLLLDYVRRIFGRPKKAGASSAARDTSDDDVAGQDDDDFRPRGNAASSSRADGGGKRKKHKPMGRSEQTQAIQNLKGKLAQFNNMGPSGSESPTHSGFHAAHAAAESSGDEESEESEEE